MVERVSRRIITEDLSWTLLMDMLCRKARQWLHFLRKLRKFGMNLNIITNFYRSTIKNLLTGCVMV